MARPDLHLHAAAQAARPVAVLSYYNVNAASSGGTRRVSELLRAIGPERVRLIQPRAPHPAYATRAFRPDFGARRVGINWGMFNFHWPPTARRVRRWLAEDPPACLVLESIWCWTPFARSGAPAPMILDAHNVDAVAIEERFGRRHPFTRLVERCEAQAIRAAARIFVCSDVDRDQMLARYAVEPARLQVIPNGADCPPAEDLGSRPLSPDLEARLEAAKVLLFIGGKMDYPPNAEGFAFIRDRLFPELEQQRPGGYRMLVVGAPAPDGERLHPSILPLGRLPALAPVLRRADVCLAPIFSGSGTRLKVLDYLAWGKPVVATPKAVEGISGCEGEHWLAASAEQFAAAVERLANDPEESARLGTNGRALVAARYSWPAIRAQWQAGLAPWL
jgi:glycosyltransferase involved in cell wall biosynthesis